MSDRHHGAAIPSDFARRLRRSTQAGCLIVLNSAGHVVETISGPPIDGPWDLTGCRSETTPCCSSPTS